MKVARPEEPLHMVYLDEAGHYDMEGGHGPMMGSTHSLSGAVIWLAIAMPLGAHVHPIAPATLVTGAAVAAGAAILPDADHPSATPARMLGPASAALCRGIGTISGGHRGGTHSLVGAAAFTVAATLAVLNTWTLAAVVWLCIGLGVRALWGRPKRRPGRSAFRGVVGLLPALAAAYLAFRVARSDVAAAVVPCAVAVGYLSHLAGDCLTRQGVPWLWPDPRRYRIAGVRTGHVAERWVVVPALYVTLATAVYLAT